jgi:hypothetical protein
LAWHQRRAKLSKGEHHIMLNLKHAHYDESRETDSSVLYLQSKPEHPLPGVTLVSGVGCSHPLTVQSKAIGKRRTLGTQSSPAFLPVVVLLYVVSTPISIFISSDG